MDIQSEHTITEWYDRAAVHVTCTCGWSRKFLRRQNALARASKVRAARADHQREIEALTARR
jgi:hypothetical protein